MWMAMLILIKKIFCTFFINLNDDVDFDQENILCNLHIHNALHYVNGYYFWLLKYFLQSSHFGQVKCFPHSSHLHCFSPLWFFVLSHTFYLVIVTLHSSHLCCFLLIWILYVWLCFWQSKSLYTFLTPVLFVSIINFLVDCLHL